MPDNELRIARHVAGQVAADQARVDVIGAAWRVAEIQRAGLPAVEVADVVGVAG